MTDEPRYEFTGKLGEGGRGSVYEAYDRQLSRKVAIKRLHPGEGMDPEEAFAMVLEESHALSALNSPHIVRIFDVGQDGEGPYAVMELLHGKTLDEAVGRAPLLEQDFHSVAEQSLEALVAAHSANLLHRDIKPANLMLTWLPSGRVMVKLLDFGLAQFEASPDGAASGGSVIGSIYFMAPELFDHQAPDARTDLYALGCVFYFALAGSHPFGGDTATEVMASHVTGNCADLKTERPDVPAALCDWVMGLVAADPEARPASAQAALEELETLRRQSLTATSAVSAHTGPVSPATGPVRTITGPISTATGPAPTATGPLPVTTRPSLSGRPASPGNPGAPAGLDAGAGLPKWFFPTVAILVLLITGLVVAVVVRLRADEDPPPGNTSAGRIEPSPAPPPPAPPRPAAPEPTPSRPAVIPKGPPPKRPAPAADDWAGRFLALRDKNTDGRLTFNEYLPTFDRKLRESERKAFDGMDTNRDGALELAEVRKKGAGVAQYFVRDTNNDLRLDLAEWLAGRPDRSRDSETAVFRRKDADRDGFLTIPEFRAAPKGGPPKTPGAKPKPAGPGDTKPAGPANSS